ncbi:host attachment protein [Thiohalobacter thiocyanaticus]|uniref:Host attachment protein n=1 Tax=Thiohalobacter thiocyanaticus TaxID=585455 RepID=A0A426QMA0_9GAMM|nr:host attachment protein [Thiohalobacter thiocyanaticus]RRQ22894.1 host attachment protein [Thiohalobacter thiocyanaticus]
MSRTWVIVAESSRAKIYEAETAAADLVEREDMVHPEGRLHERDLVSDRPGHDSGEAGSGPHVLDEHTPAHIEEMHRFAREIAGRLEQGLNDKAYDRLVLVAPPKFLGALRDALPQGVAGLVAETLHKDLVQHSTEEVRQQVQTLL